MHAACAGVARHDGEGQALRETIASAREALAAWAAANGMGDDRLAEWQTIAEGLIYAYTDRIWCTLRRDYEPVAIEEEMQIPILKDEYVEIVFRCFPDLIMAPRRGDNGLYVELKTTGSNDAKWLNQWATAVQIQAGMDAATEGLHAKGKDIHVNMALVIGLYKGFERDGKMVSPLAWGYRKQGVPGMVEDQYAGEYRKGWDKIRVADLTMGVEAWTQLLGDEVMAKQVFQTAPIFRQDLLLQAFYQQTSFQEDQVLHAVRLMRQVAGMESMAEEDKEAAIEEVMDRHFPQSFNQCVTRYGPCPFLKACTVPWIRKDPVGSGLYRLREKER